MEEREKWSKRSSQANNKQYLNKSIEERESKLRKQRLKDALARKRKYETETHQNKM